MVDVEFVTAASHVVNQTSSRNDPWNISISQASNNQISSINGISRLGSGIPKVRHTAFAHAHQNSSSDA